MYWSMGHYPVLFQPYLLQVIYIAFQYLTVSCIPAIEYYLTLLHNFMNAVLEKIHAVGADA